MKNSTKLLAAFVVSILVGASLSFAAPSSTTQSWSNFTHWMEAGYIAVDSSKNKGSLTLANPDAGVAVKQVAVTAGSVCACSEQTDVTKKSSCSVTSGILSAYGTDTDVISYVCL